MTEHCDCAKYPNMHDSQGICTNWERHALRHWRAGTLIANPCPARHYQNADGTRKQNAETSEQQAWAQIERLSNADLAETDRCTVCGAQGCTLPHPRFR
jgi:hypothetical protein